MESLLLSLRMFPINCKFERRHLFEAARQRSAWFTRKKKFKGSFDYIQVFFYVFPNKIKNWKFRSLNGSHRKSWSSPFFFDYEAKGNGRKERLKEAIPVNVNQINIFGVKSGRRWHEEEQKNQAETTECRSVEESCKITTLFLNSLKTLMWLMTMWLFEL